MKLGRSLGRRKLPPPVGAPPLPPEATSLRIKDTTFILFPPFRVYFFKSSKIKGSMTTNNWLLTAYEKEKPASASSSDIETEPRGKRNGTATPQNGLSKGKDTISSKTAKTKGIIIKARNRIINPYKLMNTESLPQVSDRGRDCDRDCQGKHRGCDRQGGDAAGLK